MLLMFFNKFGMVIKDEVVEAYYLKKGRMSDETR